MKTISALLLTAVFHLAWILALDMQAGTTDLALTGPVGFICALAIAFPFVFAWAFVAVVSAWIACEIVKWAAERSAAILDLFLIANTALLCLVAPFAS